MGRPAVELDNSDSVYDFYLDHRPNRLRARAICAAMARRYRPRVHSSEIAKSKLAEVFSRRVPIVVAINHIAENDSYVIAGSAWKGPLRPIIGRSQTLAKDELFTADGHRRLIDAMGGIPVFRGKDHGIRATNSAAQRLIDVCATRLARRDHLVLFPEGTCNKSDPEVVQAVGSGLGHIVFRAAKHGVSPVVVPVGLSYGLESEGRDASVWIGEPVSTLPTRPLDISRLVRDELQHAVDEAVARY